MTALRTSTAPIPPGELILGNIKASAGGSGKIAVGPPGGKVSFSGHADAAFSVGVYVDGADAIKAVGPDSCLMASDAGEAWNPPAPEVLRMFIASMLELGIDVDDVHRMTHENPARALGIDPDPPKAQPLTLEDGE